MMDEPLFKIGEAGWVAKESIKDVGVGRVSPDLARENPYLEGFPL